VPSHAARAGLTAACSAGRRPPVSEARRAAEGAGSGAGGAGERDAGGDASPRASGRACEGGLPPPSGGGASSASVVRYEDAIAAPAGDSGGAGPAKGTVEEKGEGCAAAPPRAASPAPTAAADRMDAPAAAAAACTAASVDAATMGLGEEERSEGVEKASGAEEEEAGEKEGARRSGATEAEDSETPGSAPAPAGKRCAGRPGVDVEGTPRPGEEESKLGRVGRATDTGDTLCILRSGPLEIWDFFF